MTPGALKMIYEHILNGASISIYTCVHLSVYSYTARHADPGREGERWGE